MGDGINLAGNNGIKLQRAQQAVPERIAARRHFASRGFGARAALGISAVSCDLFFARHIRTMPFYFLITSPLCLVRTASLGIFNRSTAFILFLEIRRDVW